jgi:hypothetical protein
VAVAERSAVRAGYSAVVIWIWIFQLGVGLFLGIWMDVYFDSCDLLSSGGLGACVITTTPFRG